MEISKHLYLEINFIIHLFAQTNPSCKHKYCDWLFTHTHFSRAQCEMLLTFELKYELLQYFEFSLSYILYGIFDANMKSN